MNAPTLLIGLGGTGCKIIERVSKMVTPEQRNNIAFAVFDTDINDLRAIEERNPFIKIIQTSTKQTVGEYLDKDTNARDTWFPVNAILNGKTLTEGAGQVRAALDSRPRRAPVFLRCGARHRDVLCAAPDARPPQRRGVRQPDRSFRRGWPDG